MSWAFIAASAISAYAASKDKDKDKDDSLEVLRERFRLEEEQRQANRQYRSNAYDGWSQFGQGGEQGGMWGSMGQQTPSVLAPRAFRQQQGNQVAMPWGQGMGMMAPQQPMQQKPIASMMGGGRLG